MPVFSKGGVDCRQGIRCDLIEGAVQRMSITAGLGMCIGDHSNPTAARSHSRPKTVLFDVRATVPVDGLFLYHLRPFPTLIEGSGVSPRHNSVRRASESRQDLLICLSSKDAGSGKPPAEWRYIVRHLTSAWL